MRHSVRDDEKMTLILQVVHASNLWNRNRGRYVFCRMTIYSWISVLIDLCARLASDECRVPLFAIHGGRRVKCILNSQPARQSLAAMIGVDFDSPEVFYGPRIAC